MTGRHTGPIRVPHHQDWNAHVRNTRRAAITVGIIFLAFCGALIAIILHKTGIL